MEVLKNRTASSALSRGTQAIDGFGLTWPGVSRNRTGRIYPARGRYVARLDDGALVYVENCGVRFGPSEVMARVTRGEPVDPAEVYFRSAPRFETAEPAYQWLTRPLFIAAGARYPDRVALSVFEVG